MGKRVSEKPAIGIRPIVDGREGPMQLRASLEPQVTAMANAAKTLTEVPARLLKVKKGRIEKGYDADIAVFDDDITIESVFVGGKIKI